MTRTHIHQETFSATPSEVFALLITPSAIRQWWSASNAIVIPQQGGTWSAAWGEEDDPDYITSATLKKFEPPRKLVMADYQYFAKSGPLPFDALFETEFLVAEDQDGTSLKIEQHGFPDGQEADEYLDACRKGWTDTFAGIRRYLSGMKS